MPSGGLFIKGITKKFQENMPVITVVTVVRNCEKTLEKTILSVVNQTYINIEYIIVDGASTDGTLDIIRKYENIIDYWISESDKGIYDAMNKGIDLAKGDWINFMNSGDSFYSDIVLNRIFENEISKEIDIIYGDTFLVYNDSTYIKKAKPLDCFVNCMPFGHQASFVNTKLMKMSKFDDTYKSSGDYNFFYHCYLKKKYFLYIPIIVDSYNAEYGVSLDYKLVNYENARIHGDEKKLKWKIKFYINYCIYLIKCLSKKILTKELIKKIREKKYLYETYI